MSGQVTEFRQPWTLAKFKPVHAQIAQMHVAGKNSIEIAEIVGWHKESVRRILKTPLMKGEIARLQGDLDNLLFEADLRLKNLVHRSIDVLEDVLGEPMADKSPAGDLDQQTKVAWKVLESVLKLNRGDGNVHLTQIQNIQQVMIDAQTKSDKDLVKDVTARIRESKDAST